MSCHSVINPLGFSLENFDAVGRFRLNEKQKPIDVSSVYQTPLGKKIKLNGPRDLAVFLAGNKQVQRSFVNRLFDHYAKQPIGAFPVSESDDCTNQLDRLHRKFEESEFNVRQLLIEIALVVVNQKHLQGESND